MYDATGEVWVCTMRRSRSIAQLLMGIALLGVAPVVRAAQQRVDGVASLDDADVEIELRGHCPSRSYGQVSTVEVDADVAAEATARLDAGGYLHNVRVIVGDGATAAPADRPWDRVIATAAVPLGRLPYGWVKHTRPGGVIVAPMFADLTSEPLVRLVVSDDATARGHADAQLTVEFMHLRAERPARAALGAIAWDDESADLIHTSADIWDPLHHQAWCWAMAVAMPSCRYNTYQPGERSERRLILFKDPVSGSWASIHGADDDGLLAVRQSGPRRLGDEALAAIRWFAQRGAPPLEAWLWEVGPDQQSVTLPDQ